MEPTRRHLAEKMLQSLDTTGKPLSCDRDALMAELDQETKQIKNLPVKIISMLGGGLGALLFTGFLLGIGMWESAVGMLVLGILFLAGAILLVQHANNTFFSSGAIAFLIIGLILFSIGTDRLLDSIAIVCIALLLLSTILYFTSRHSTVLFLLTLVFSGSLLGLVLQTEVPMLMHLYVALLAVALLVWCLAEIPLISKSIRINHTYRPLRMGLVVAFALFMLLLAWQGLFEIKMPFPWASGLILLFAMLAFTYLNLQRLRIGEEKRAYWYTCMPLLVLPLIGSPAVVGSFLLILLAFHLRHLPSLLVGIAAFCFTLFMFYYDLQLTLMEKSGMLLLSAAWFFLGCILTIKNAKK